MKTTMHQCEPNQYCCDSVCSSEDCNTFEIDWTVVICPIFFIFLSVVCLIPCYVEYCCKIYEYCRGFDGCQNV